VKDGGEGRTSEDVKGQGKQCLLLRYAKGYDDSEFAGGVDCGACVYSKGVEALIVVSSQSIDHAQREVR